jgi:hypothetical protein
MKYARPVPTSLVRSSTLTIVTYDACDFLAVNSYHIESPPRMVVSPLKSTVRATVLATAFLMITVLLAVAVARADTANSNEQATFVRFTNKVTFGAAQGARIQGVLDSALSRLAAIGNQKTQMRVGALTSATGSARAFPGWSASPVRWRDTVGANRFHLRHVAGSVRWR